MSQDQQPPDSETAHLVALCDQFGWRTDGDADTLISRITHHIRDMKACIGAHVAVATEYAHQEPVAWRHSHTHCLYENRDEVPLADGDEWAEPLCLAPHYVLCARRPPAPTNLPNWNTNA